MIDWQATPCIIPPNVPEANGYVRVSVRAQHYYAHRLAYEVAHGVIPKGLTVDHLCRQRSCVNVFHLDLVTAEENVARGWKRGSHAQAATCINGHTGDFTTNGAGHRVCLVCKRARRTKERDARRAARAAA